MNRYPRGVAAVVGPAALAVVLAACSSTPAVCTDLNSVQATMHKLKNLQPGTNTVSDLQRELQTLNKQVRQLAGDASKQYSSQITAVKSSVQALQSDVSAAVSNPSAASVSALQKDVKQLQSSMKKLSSAVSTTC